MPCLATLNSKAVKREGFVFYYLNIGHILPVFGKIPATQFSPAVQFETLRTPHSRGTAPALA